MIADILDLGRTSYQEARAYQLQLVQERIAGERPDALVLVEHPHVITVGRARYADGNVLAAGELPVVSVERGGDATYHGPGQLVAYLIVQLGEQERDLRRFMRNLEQGIIELLGDFQLQGSRSTGNTGVWVGAAKIASIGIACRKWVTYHGLALNVNTELSYFQRINPCGFDASIMTSMQRELGGKPVDFDAVKRRASIHLGRALGRDFGTRFAG